MDDQLSCEDSGEQRWYKVFFWLKEEKISKDGGTIFHVYQGSEGEKEKYGMEWGRLFNQIK